MPNLICNTEIDAALIDQFSAEGTGFPDQALLNPKTGKLDVSVLEKMIGVSRAIRRLESKLKPGSRLVDFQSSSAGRFKLLLNDLHNLHVLSQKKAKRVVGVRSWEGVIFSAIDSTWLEPTSAVAQRFNAFTQEDREALEAMLSKRLEWLESAKTLESEKREYVKRREYFKPLGGMVGVLLDQLEGWDSLNDSQRQLLADGAYAAATPFGNELLGIFVTRQPGLMKYYSIMLENERLARTADQAVEATIEATEDSQACSETTAKSLSLYDLYSELFQLAQQAKSDAGNLLYAEQIEALITSNLPRLRQEYSLS